MHVDVHYHIIPLRIITERQPPFRRKEGRTAERPSYSKALWPLSISLSLERDFHFEAWASTSRVEVFYSFMSDAGLRKRVTYRISVSIIQSVSLSGYTLHFTNLRGRSLFASHFELKINVSVAAKRGRVRYSLVTFTVRVILINIVISLVHCVLSRVISATQFCK